MTLLAIHNMRELEALIFQNNLHWDPFYYEVRDYQ
jgi:hypothetical protein